jgi:hypothetical protein
MFVITHNDTVVLGPMPWRKLLFQNFLLDEYEVNTTLQADTPTDVVTVNAEIKIYPMRWAAEPAYNKKIEFLNGPFWNITPTYAEGSFVVESYPLDTAKGMLKQVVAENRWKKEVSGIKHTVNTTEVTLDTTREGRGIYLQAYQANIATRWKFPEGWLDLSVVELGALVSAIVSHVQTCFEWESDTNDLIDAAVDAAALDAIATEMP